MHNASMPQPSSVPARCSCFHALREISAAPWVVLRVTELNTIATENGVGNRFQLQLARGAFQVLEILYDALEMVLVHNRLTCLEV